MYGKSIYVVKNNDDKCLAAACFLAILYDNKINDSTFSIVLNK